MERGAVRDLLGPGARRQAGELGKLFEDAVTMFSAFQLAASANGHEVSSEGIRALAKSRAAASDAYLHIWQMLAGQKDVQGKLSPASHQFRLRADHARVALTHTCRPYSLIYPPSIPLPETVSFFGTDAYPALDLMSLRPGSLVALDVAGNGTRAMERNMLIPLASKLHSGCNLAKLLPRPMSEPEFAEWRDSFIDTITTAAERELPQLVKLYVVTEVWFEQPALPEDVLRYLGSFPGPVNESGRYRAWMHRMPVSYEERVEQALRGMPQGVQKRILTRLQLPRSTLLETAEKLSLQLPPEDTELDQRDKRSKDIMARKKPPEPTEMTAEEAADWEPSIWRQSLLREEEADQALDREIEACELNYDLACPRLRQKFQAADPGTWSQMRELKQSSQLPSPRRNPSLSEMRDEMDELKCIPDPICRQYLDLAVDMEESSTDGEEETDSDSSSSEDLSSSQSESTPADSSEDDSQACSDPEFQQDPEALADDTAEILPDETANSPDDPFDDIVSAAEKARSASCGAKKGVSPHAHGKRLPRHPKRPSGSSRAKGSGASSKEADEPEVYLYSSGDAEKALRIPKGFLNACLREGYSEDYVRALSGMRVRVREIQANESAIDAWREKVEAANGNPKLLRGRRPPQPILPLPDLAGSPYTPSWLLRPPVLGSDEVVLNELPWPAEVGPTMGKTVEGYRTLLDIVPLADPEQDGLVYCPEAGEECLAFHQVAGRFRKCTIVSEPSRLTRFHARVCFHTKPVWVRRNGREVLEWVPNEGREQEHSDVYARFIVPLPGAAITDSLGTVMMGHLMRVFQ